MKMNSIMLLFVAGLCGLVAMFGVHQAMSQKPEPTEQLVRVMQAAVEIQPGDQLNETNTQMIEVNARACPEGVVTELSQIEQRALKVPAMPGDWILVGKLTEKGETGPAANVPKGMRALTISVDATQTHSGMLRPGNRVDIQLTYDCKSATACKRKVARTILQYVEIFAVDDRVYGNDKSPDSTAMAKNISVLVTPEQSNMLCLARSMGILSTTLRSNGDTEEIAGVEVSDEMFGNSGESNAANPSVMDVRAGLDGKSGPVLFEDNPPIPGVDFPQPGKQPAVSPDPGGSMPVIELAQADVPKNTWTMEIYEGGNVRLESIELPETAEASGTISTDTKPGFWSSLGLTRAQNP